MAIPVGGGEADMIGIPGQAVEWDAVAAVQTHAASRLCD